MIPALEEFEYTRERLEQAYSILLGVDQKIGGIRRRAEKGLSDHGEDPAALSSYTAARAHLVDFIQRATDFQVRRLNKRAANVALIVGEVRS